MFAEAAGWARPIRFAKGTGGHAPALEVAEQVARHGVRRLVFAHIGRPPSPRWTPGTSRRSERSERKAPCTRSAAAQAAVDAAVAAGTAMPQNPGSGA